MKKFFFLISFLMTCTAHAAVVASVEYPNITEGQILQLRLSSDTRKDGAPEVAPLENDFQIIGTANSTSYQNINGKASISHDFIFNLLPKKTGTLTIPALTWNNEKTQAFEITVSKAQTTYQTKEKETTTITGQVVNKNVYENAGITYRAQVATNMDFFDGEFTAPSLPDAAVIPTGQMQAAKKVENGVAYRVFSQDFMIFPKTAGKQTIQGATFHGLFVKKTYRQQRTLLEPFLYGAMAGQQDEVFLRAKDVSVDVLTRPDAWQGKWWLPSTNVVLKESYSPDSEQIEFGNSITRNIETSALNVMGSQIPDISFSSSDDFKIYSQTPLKTELYHPGQGVIGSSSQSFVFVPLKTGKLTLPAVSLAWFDTATGQSKTAELPPRIIHVNQSQTAPVLQQVDDEPKPDHHIGSATTPESKPSVAPKANKYEKENAWLYFIAGACCSFVIMALIIALLFIRPKKKSLPDLYPKE